MRSPKTIASSRCYRSWGRIRSWSRGSGGLGRVGLAGRVRRDRVKKPARGRLWPGFPDDSGSVRRWPTAHASRDLKETVAASWSHRRADTPARSPTLGSPVQPAPRGLGRSRAFPGGPAPFAAGLGRGGPDWCPEGWRGDRCAQGRRGRVRPASPGNAPIAGGAFRPARARRRPSPIAPRTARRDARPSGLGPSQLVRRPVVGGYACADGDPPIDDPCRSWTSTTSSDSQRPERLRASSADPARFGRCRCRRNPALLA